MTQNQEQWLIHLIGVLPSRWTSMGWEMGWHDKNLMKFNKATRKVLHLGRNNPTYQDCLGADGLESSFMEKDLGVVVGNKLNMNQQWLFLARKKTRSFLGCIRWRTASRWRLWSWPSAQHGWGHTWSAGSRSGLPSGRETWSYLWESTEGSQRKLMDLSIWQEEAEWAEKRRLRGISSWCINTWREGVKRMEPDSSWWYPLSGQEVGVIEIQKKSYLKEDFLFFLFFFNGRSGQALHQSAQTGMESPSLQILKTWLQSVLGNMLYLTLLWAGGWTPEIPSNLNYSVTDNSIELTLPLLSEASHSGTYTSLKQIQTLWKYNNICVNSQTLHEEVR